MLTRFRDESTEPTGAHAPTLFPGLVNYLSKALRA
jgi:hypothetical protein